MPKKRRDDPISNGYRFAGCVRSPMAMRFQAFIVEDDQRQVHDLLLRIVRHQRIVGRVGGVRVRDNR